MSDYAKRVAQQIEQFADIVEMHDLPAIFHVWSHEFVRVGLHDVFGVESVTDFYVSAYRDAVANSCRGIVFSIGCGDGSIEIDLAKALLKAGVSNFKIIGADLSPILIGTMHKKVQAEGLDRFIEPIEADLNYYETPEQFDVVMAHHSLHHIVI